MKIIISPSKEKKTLPFEFETTKPYFFNKAEFLVKKLKKLDVNQIQLAFKCSKSIAKDVYISYQNFNEIVHPALFYFNGLQYKYLDVLSLEKDEISFLLDKVLIADALYGLLRATDEISNYRLDYKTKLPFFNYDYYKNDLDEIIDQPVINLCSKEFSRNLNQDKLFTINFVQNLNGKIKSYSTHTKIARGKFLRYLAKNKSTSFDVIKKFKEDGYYLISESKSELTFQKDL